MELFLEHSCFGLQSGKVITGEDRDMVRAINRIIGSEVEQRTLSTFNYNIPASIRDDSPQQHRRPPRKFFEGNKGRNKKAPRMDYRM